MDRRSSWAKVFSKPAVSRNFNEPLLTRNAAARSHRPSLMKLRIQPIPRPADEEEHAEEQQVRAVAHKLRLLTLVPLSCLQCDSKSTKARSVKSKPSSTGRANSSSVPLASSQRR